MSTAGGGNATTSSSHAIIPAPIVTADTKHVCFICLQTDVDDPNQTWVSPCPCSLEAHEDCMLRYVAEMEGPSRSKSGLKCPACKAPIMVDEPFDPVVAFRDRLHQRYSRVSPVVLLIIVTGGSIAGSAWYGWSATAVFAGVDSATRWLDFSALRCERLPGGPHSLMQTLPAWLVRVWVLSLIGPGLVITRALPFLNNLISVPLSVLSAITLMAYNDVPSWPPSPEWAITIMPYVQLTYSNLYHAFFGSLERRLNRALRGRPAVEEAPAPQGGAAAAARRQEEEEPGLWATFIGLGRAVVGLFNEGPVEDIEVAVRIGGGIEEEEVHDHFHHHHHDHDHDHDHEHDEDEVVDGDEVDENFVDLAQIRQQIAHLERVAAEHDLADARNREAQAGADVAMAVQRVQQQQQQQQQQQEAAPAPAPAPAQAAPPPPAPAAEDNRGSTTFTDIINSIVTSLLFPAISYGMGEVIRSVAPRSWVEKRASPTGLLQQRWGRSLIGGCLFVVLKDAFTLYTKYRRVQVKRNRKVRNVPKRTAEVGNGGGVAAR
ncbi:hypothetical protein QBC46DRAFT_452477 [Diplogelasinospora grovesii]|uniref:RING-type domain-containing protein n=1 Tax=Diplogelasinospora grovesii TaxID=303347 RepID=A0AAN6S187_9PEZI|nr:hypothetical protein QBC46DRAFT_452477 [Diplogelasinospora grovesii]